MKIYGKGANAPAQHPLIMHGLVLSQQYEGSGDDLLDAVDNVCPKLAVIYGKKVSHI